jgi:sulfopyruvate decarboxylase TPP-binding subunit
VFSGEQFEQLLGDLGVTHVVTVPDGTLGRWEPAITAGGRIRVIHVCREGEAWGVAAGLHFGGATPVVMIQCTGFFESGDALRNVLHDWKLPIFSIIGYRSYLSQEMIPGDTCLVFTEPLLDAWRIDWVLMDSADKIDMLHQHYRACTAGKRAGAVLIAEGKS